MSIICMCRNHIHLLVCTCPQISEKISVSHLRSRRNLWPQPPRWGCSPPWGWWSPGIGCTGSSGSNHLFAERSNKKCRKNHGKSGLNQETSTRKIVVTSHFQVKHHPTPKCFGANETTVLSPLHLPSPGRGCAWAPGGRSPTMGAIAPANPSCRCWGPGARWSNSSGDGQVVTGSTLDDFPIWKWWCSDAPSSSSL